MSAPLKFPSRVIVTLPFNAMAHAQGAVREAADDLMLAACEAFNRKDVSALLALRKDTRELIEALEIVSGMALDLADRI